jgi:gas vesicle protein
MTDPDQIRYDIQRTRDNLSDDVDALAYKASPSRMVSERTDRVRGALSGARNAVMGAASDAADKTKSATSTVTDSAGNAPGGIARAARGNPVAAGLIVFGAAWLVSSLMPRTDREQQAAAQVKEVANQHVGEVTDAVQEIGDNLKEPAQQAVDAVKSTATDAAHTVQHDTQSAAHDLRS